MVFCGGLLNLRTSIASLTQSPKLLEVHVHIVAYGHPGKHGCPNAYGPLEVSATHPHGEFLSSLVSRNSTKGREVAERSAEKQYNRDRMILSGLAAEGVCAFWPAMRCHPPCVVSCE